MSGTLPSKRAYNSIVLLSVAGILGLGACVLQWYSRNWWYHHRGTVDGVYALAGVVPVQTRRWYGRHGSLPVVATGLSRDTLVSALGEPDEVHKGRSGIAESMAGWHFAPGSEWPGEEVSPCVLVWRHADLGIWAWLDEEGTVVALGVGRS